MGQMPGTHPGLEGLRFLCSFRTWWVSINSHHPASCLPYRKVSVATGIWDPNTSPRLFSSPSSSLPPPQPSPFAHFLNHYAPPSVANALWEKAMKFWRIILLFGRFGPTVSSKETWENPWRPWSQCAASYSGNCSNWTQFEPRSLAGGIAYFKSKAPWLVLMPKYKAYNHIEKFT